MEELLRASISRRPGANGLAIIVANERSCKEEHKLLCGVAQDLLALKWAFEYLNFATLPLLNVAGESVLCAVKAAAQAQYPQSYRRFVFVFSGHGDEGCIYTHTRPLRFRDDVFLPFMPCNSADSDLTRRDLPKIFLIDSCRGDSIDQGVEIVPRGSKILPSLSNYLLACSTQNLMQSFETAVGGFWSQLVAERLCTDRRSILDVLTALNKDVNRRILEFHSGEAAPLVQQPVLESTLNEVVNLLSEASGTLPAVIIEQPIIEGLPSSLSQQRGQPSQSHRVSTRGALSHLACLPSSNAAPAASVPEGLEWTHFIPPIVHLVSSNAEPGSPQMIDQGPHQGACSDHPVGHFRSELNHYQQKGLIKDYSTASFREKLSGNDHFKSTLTVTLGSSGESITGSSKEEYSSKQGAREMAAKDVVEKIRQKVQQVPAAVAKQTPSPPTTTGRQVSRQSTSGTPPTVQSGHYKSKLNDYQQLGHISGYCGSGSFTDKLKYESGKDHFSSSVTVTFGTSRETITGHSRDFYPSKQTAREMAAKDAVEQIDRALSTPGSLCSPSQRGITLPTTPSMTFTSTAGATAVGKNSKMKLKEYFDRMGLSSAPPCYRRVSVDGGRFRAEVKLPGDPVEWVAGDVKPTAKEADHDAAREALSRL